MGMARTDCKFANGVVTGAYTMLYNHLHKALFEPQRLDKNIYKNLLKGMKYLWHYQHGTLPDYEMERWSGKLLTMNDLFDFSTLTEEAGWRDLNYATTYNTKIKYGYLEGGIKVMLQGTSLKYPLQLDPVHNYQIRILQNEPFVTRRIGFIDFGKQHSSYYKNARDYIYSPWK